MARARSPQRDERADGALPGRRGSVGSAAGYSPGMRPKAMARFRDPAALRAHLAEVGAAMPVDDRLEGCAGPLGESSQLFGRRADNRFAVHPMEGWDGTRDGRPGKWTLRRWHRFGRSGAALLWGGEAVAVCGEGRANPYQLCVETTPEPVADLVRLRQELERGRREAGLDPEGMVRGLQLTHSGRWARPEGPLAPRIVRHDSRLDRRVGLGPGSACVSDAELERIAGHYVTAARYAFEAGFHFVDLKACHGYLVHELLAAHDRPGPYGGSFEHRCRFLLDLVTEVRRLVPGLGIGVRLSVADLPPHRVDPEAGIGVVEPPESGDSRPFGGDAAGSFELGEPLQLVSRLRDRGVEAINVTLGSPYTCPHLQRPAAFPPSDGYQPPRDPLCEVARHLMVTRTVKQAQPSLHVVGSGVSYLQDFVAHVAQATVRDGGADFVGLGRMTLSYPDLPRDVLEGRELRRRAICRTFSACTTSARLGMRSGCYPLDRDYRNTEEFTRLRDWEQSQRRRLS